MARAPGALEDAGFVPLSFWAGQHHWFGVTRERVINGIEVRDDRDVFVIGEVKHLPFRAEAVARPKTHQPLLRMPKKFCVALGLRKIERVLDQRVYSRITAKFSANRHPLDLCELGEIAQPDRCGGLAIAVGNNV